MEREPSSETAKLPLHPRKAQQVFLELIQWKSKELTPQVAMTPLPKRIHHVQELYLSGVYEAKRGQEFDFHLTDAAPERVMIQLTKDGSTLQMRIVDQVKIVRSVKLVDIQQIIVLALPKIGFQLQLCAISNQQDEGEPAMSTLLFMAPTELSTTVVNQWVLTLTCGANAFQQQLQSDCEKPPPTMNLIWQAARLRIFELAGVLPLHDAVALVTLGVHQFLSEDEIRGLFESQTQQPLLFLSAHSA